MTSPFRSPLSELSGFSDFDSDHEDAHEQLCSAIFADIYGSLEGKKSHEEEQESSLVEAEEPVTDANGSESFGFLNYVLCGGSDPSLDALFAAATMPEPPAPPAPPETAEPAEDINVEVKQTEEEPTINEKALTTVDEEVDSVFMSLEQNITGENTACLIASEVTNGDVEDDSSSDDEFSDASEVPPPSPAPSSTTPSDDYEESVYSFVSRSRRRSSRIKRRSSPATTPDALEEKPIDLLETSEEGPTFASDLTIDESCSYFDELLKKQASFPTFSKQFLGIDSTEVDMQSSVVRKHTVAIQRLSLLVEMQIAAFCQSMNLPLYLCHICGLLLQSNRLLRLHSWRCNMKIRESSRFYESIIAVNTKLIKKYKARKLSLRRAMIGSEQEESQEEETKPKIIYKCQFCPFWSYTACWFHQHFQAHIEYREKFECTACTYQSSWVLEIVDHIHFKRLETVCHNNARFRPVTIFKPQIYSQFKTLTTEKLDTCREFQTCYGGNMLLKARLGPIDLTELSDSDTENTNVAANANSTVTQDEPKLRRASNLFNEGGVLTKATSCESMLIDVGSLDNDDVIFNFNISELESDNSRNSFFSESHSSALLDYEEMTLDPERPTYFSMSRAIEEMTNETPKPRKYRRKSRKRKGKGKASGVNKLAKNASAKPKQKRKKGKAKFQCGFCGKPGTFKKDILVHCVEEHNSKFSVEPIKKAGT